MILSDMTWPEIEAAAQSTSPPVAVLPLAAIEQHGPHLAVSTDTTLVTAVAERVEAALTSQVLLCPTFTFGSSHHHRGFPGALTLSPNLYAQVLLELIESLLQNGFRKIFLLNGHGGNIVPAQQALAMFAARSEAEREPNIALASYWELAAEHFKGAPPMESPALTHACEYESSMMLHLYPERVHMDRAQRAQVRPANNYIGWENEVPFRGVSMGWRTHFVTDNGCTGQPQLATAGKGEHLLERAVAATVAFLRDFQSWPFLSNIRNQKSCPYDLNENSVQSNP